LVGQLEEHQACKKFSGEVLAWLFMKQGVNCIWSIGPTDATATHLLLHKNPEWFNLSGAGLPRLCWKKVH